MAQKMPIASRMSPMLTTSRMIGMGRGTTSPKTPPWRTKLGHRAGHEQEVERVADERRRREAGGLEGGSTRSASARR